MKERQVEFEFHSGLKMSLLKFLQEKRMMGFKYVREAYSLQSLDRHAMTFSCENTLTKELVLSWTQRAPHQKATTVLHSISTVNEFAKFMQRNGFEAYVLPKTDFPKTSNDFICYIFTHEEISRFFQAASQLPQSPYAVLRHISFPVIFRLLYGCGLRANEALHLRIKQVNLQDGILEITNAKAYRDRLVPVSPPLQQLLQQYLSVLPHTQPDDFLFPSPHPQGGAYHIFTLRTAFYDILQRAAIPYRGRNFGPRMHDFRHPYVKYTLKIFLLIFNHFTARKRFRNVPVMLPIST